MSRLARECIHHPQILKWTSQKRIVFRKGKTPFRSTNKLLSRMDNCDGLKTGYIRKAGFCITATAVKNGIRVITVVMGHRDPEQRFRQAKRELEQGLDTLELRTVATASDPTVPVIPVENCEVESVRLALKDDLQIPITEALWPKVEMQMEHPRALEAPVAAGTEVGDVVVRLDDMVLARTKLLVPEELPKASWMWRTRKRVTTAFTGED
jgi:D-alanyl-D-alanine carboxypeptidase (penicillin-binding protein 5/6)